MAFVVHVAGCVKGPCKEETVGSVLPQFGILGSEQNRNLHEPILWSSGEEIS